MQRIWKSKPKASRKANPFVRGEKANTKANRFWDRVSNKLPHQCQEQEEPWQASGLALNFRQSVWVVPRGAFVPAYWVHASLDHFWGLSSMNTKIARNHGFSRVTPLDLHSQTWRKHISWPQCLVLQLCSIKVSKPRHQDKNERIYTHHTHIYIYIHTGPYI